MAYKIGAKVVMSEDAIENYGECYRNEVFEIESVSDKYMPAKEFFARGMPKGYHPGYDSEGAQGNSLYDLKYYETGRELPFSLYDWELEEAE